MPSLTSGVILKEQDKASVLKEIAALLDRLSVLYQIPDWSAARCVVLAEWTYENYRYEEPETIYRALRNPPGGASPTWRLTPDTVQTWMAGEIERVAAKRETENVKFKEDFKDELPGVNYDELKKRILENGIGENESSHTYKAFASGFQDPAYLKWKDEQMRKRLQEEQQKPADPPSDPH